MTGPYSVAPDTTYSSEMMSQTTENKGKHAMQQLDAPTAQTPLGKKPLPVIAVVHWLSSTTQT